MLDQSFSPNNFRKIFDIENRKGNYLDSRFFPELLLVTQQVQQKKYEYDQFKAKKKELDPDKYLQGYEKRGEELKEIRELRELKIDEEMAKISCVALGSKLSVGIKKIDIGTGKDAYTVEDNAVSYFVIRQIQYNIRRIYKVKQSNRHHIICQLREVLSDKFPKYIVKTDIESFYESIPRQKLIDKINRDPFLLVSSKRIIKEILHEYGRISGQTKGIPRGIGLSAYLSELYLRQLDDRTRRFSGVVYYARYVDDIIFIFCPPANSNPFAVRHFLINEFETLELKHNKAKTQVFSTKKSSALDFDYLGYKIAVDAGKVSIGLSGNKMARYKKRIDLAFSDYFYRANKSEKMSRVLLIKRIKFLTGNTRLVNNKRNVVSGVYFSNSLVCEKGMQDLKNIDSHLKQKAAALSPKYLRSKILSMSFVQGFENIEFYKFKHQEFAEIVEVWKYVR